MARRGTLAPLRAPRRQTLPSASKAASWRTPHPNGAPCRWTGPPATPIARSHRQGTPRRKELPPPPRGRAAQDTKTAGAPHWRQHKPSLPKRRPSEATVWSEAVPACEPPESPELPPNQRASTPRPLARRIPCAPLAPSRPLRGDGARVPRSPPAAPVMQYASIGVRAPSRGPQHQRQRAPHQGTARPRDSERGSRSPPAGAVEGPRPQRGPSLRGRSHRSSRGGSAPLVLPSPGGEKPRRWTWPLPC